MLLTLDGYVKLADMGAARGTAEDGTIKGGAGETTSSDKTAKQAALLHVRKPRRRLLTLPFPIWLLTLPRLAGGPVAHGATNDDHRHARLPRARGAPAI